MKVAYVTIKEAKNLGPRTEWSGTGYYIAQALKQQGADIDYLGPLQDTPLSRLVRKSKRLFYRQFNQKLYLKDTDPIHLKSLARQVSRQLALKKYDVVLSATVNPIAYLKTDIPIVFWADATFANTADFYPEYSNLCQETIDNGHAMERRAIAKSRFAIYSSDWAATAALDYYKADPSKVKVLRFGANLDTQKTPENIQSLIQARPSDVCKLLFLGKDWYRKGGNVAFEVAKTLNAKGLKTELTVVGCRPVGLDPLPDFVKTTGFISKFSQSGREQLTDLIASSHFLILPTLADCTPIVFSEACSLGVPCLSTNVGGIPSIIQNDVNGRLFSISSCGDMYADYITHLFENYESYLSLAQSSFDEYQLHLNWSKAGQCLSSFLLEAAKT